MTKQNAKISGWEQAFPTVALPSCVASPGLSGRSNLTEAGGSLFPPEKRPGEEKERGKPKTGQI